MKEQTSDFIDFLHAPQGELSKIDPKDYDQNCDNSCAVSLAIKIDPYMFCHRRIEPKWYRYLFGASAQILKVYPGHALRDGAITPQHAISRMDTVIRWLESALTLRTGP